jgi:hypothetical protein
MAATSVRPLVAITGAWNVAPAKPKPIKPILSNDDMAIPGYERNERRPRRDGATTAGYFGTVRCGGAYGRVRQRERCRAARTRRTPAHCGLAYRFCAI